MNKSLFEEYAKLKAKQAEVELLLKKLQPVILEELATVEDSAVEIEAGTFSVLRKKHWKYSDIVTAMSEKLDEAKAEEEAKGTAEFTEHKFVTFRANKV